MNSIFTKDYQNKKIVPILKEYSAKKYGRRREFVDAETKARLGLSIEEESLPDTPEPSSDTAGETSAETPSSESSVPSSETSTPSADSSASATE
jgi:hypothetical protein